ncbi:MAG: hypothetical protein JSW52_05385 [Candidatus Coatesbacteria bacterium]|nr:MAG: hypothetical protein JSW52_05385 [Candidatus Coatesbacteria bacterium]
MYGWDIALGLELLAVVFGFILWFKAARAEGGPRKLAKVVAIVVIILAVLLAACTVTRAFMYACGEKPGPYGTGYKCFKMMHGGFEEGKCPSCGMVHGKSHGPGMEMMGMPPCPYVEEPAPEEPETE